MANDGKALKEKLFKDKKNGWQMGTGVSLCGFGHE